jgi:predicted ATPase
MTSIDDLDTDDVDVSEVDSNVDEWRENDSKQKKTKKKKLERIIGGVSPSSRKIEQHEITDDPDEKDQHVASLTSNSGSKMKKDKIVQEEETKKKPQSVWSSSTCNAIKEDGDSHSNNPDVYDRKIPRSPKKKKKGNGKTESKSKSKPLEFKDKKKKKKKMEKSEEEDESRNKISLERAVKRISNLSMENPAEVFLISGDSGIGKSHWIESETNRILLKIQQDENDKHDAEADDVSDDDVSDDDRCPFFPVICRGTCEIPPRINRDYDDNYDKDVSESSTLTEPYYNNGCGISRPPMHAITEALNNLIRSLAISDDSCEGREKPKTTNITNIYGGKVVWKTRIKEALGITEASYLASTGLVPELGVLLNLQGFRNVGEKKKPSWDWNSPYKFHRSCLAIRDLLRAISESHHPVIMVLNNLHVADNDTHRLLNFLLTGCHWDQKQGAEALKVDVDEHQEVVEAEVVTTLTARLKNFLFIGIHEGNPKSQKDMLYLLERSFCRIRKSSLDENQAQFFQQNEHDSEVEPREQPRVQSYLTKIHMEGFRRKKVEDVLRSNILKINKNTAEDEDKTSDFKENLQDLAGLIYDWTGGNVFYVLQVFEYLKEEGAISSSPSCKWNIDKIQAQSSRWNNSIIGLTATRIDRLPKVVRFVLINASVFRQTYIEFSVQELFHLLNAAYADMGRKKKGEMEFPLESVSELETALELACDLGFMKHMSCRRNCNDSNHRWAFAHTIIRDEAYSLFAKKKRKKKMEIHMRLGTKASALAFVPTSSEQEWNEQSGDIYLSNTEHDAFKFLAADQLAIAEEILSQDCNKVVLLIVETAEMCISKSAFCAAIRYLTIGVGILERNGGRFTADNHGVCLRTYLLSARLHSVCVRGTNEIDKAFREILENGKNLKDQIMLHQAEIGISIWQNNYQEALKKVLSTLELLGEKFPQKVDLPKTISRQIENLKQEIRRKDNQNLLQPAHCTDKKTFDVMTLLSNVIEISRLCKNDVYQEIAMIRMMNICLISGFTPQYSMSFAHYGAILMERAFATNELNTAKEGYRMGQICEKVARVKNFYGMLLHYAANVRINQISNTFS